MSFAATYLKHMLKWEDTIKEQYFYLKFLTLNNPY